MTPSESEFVDGASQTIEGGAIHGLERRIEWRPERHRAETTSRIAFVLIAIFAGSFVIHYASTVCLHLYGAVEAANSLAKVYEMWLPVISGFVGGAVTFYFTRLNK